MQFVEHSFQQIAFFDCLDALRFSLVFIYRMRILVQVNGHYSAAFALALLFVLSIDRECAAKEVSANSALKSAQLLVRRRHPDLALPKLEKILRQEPKSSQALLAKADALATMGRADEGLALVSSLLRAEPNNAEALILRSNIYYLLGSYKQANADAKAAIQISPGNAEAHMALSQALRHVGKYKESDSECTKALKLEPKNSSVWRQFGLLNRSMREWPATVTALTTAIKLAPDDTRNYDDLASFYIDRKQYGKALELTSKALKIDPQDGFALMNKARLLLLRRKQNESMAVAQVAERVMPYSGYPNSLKGEVYQRMMDDDKSVDEYSKAIEKQPLCPDFYIGRGLAYSGKREYDASLKDFAHAYELGRGDVSAISLRADVYQAMNRWKESFDDLSVCIKKNPKDTTFYVRRGVVLRHLNRLSDARRDFNSAVEIHPVPANYVMRGEFYLQTKEYKNAVDDFRAALKLEPSSKKALRGLASAYEELGRKDLAEEARSRATGDMERVIDQYSRASDGFSRLKHSLGK